MSLNLMAASAVWPSGPDLALADAAHRSGLCWRRKHPFFRDRCGERVRVSYFHEPDPDFGPNRWAMLLRALLWDLARRSPPGWLSARDTPHRPRAWDGYLVLPAPEHPGRPRGLIPALEPVLHRWPRPWRRMDVIHGGHAAAVPALTRAWAGLEQDPDSVAVVLGLDCQVSAPALAALLAADLIHGAQCPHRDRPRPNPYGRVPAEGAGAVLLSRRPWPYTQPWGRLTGLASAAEPVTRTDPRPCLGQGLSQAAHQALAAASPVPIGHLWTDLTGEPYRADELGFTTLRLAPVLTPDLTRHTPVLASGDLGAATATAHLALAAWHARQRPDGQGHLLLTGSDDERRGALVLTGNP